MTYLQRLRNWRRFYEFTGPYPTDPFLLDLLEDFMASQDTLNELVRAIATDTSSIAAGIAGLKAQIDAQAAANPELDLSGLQADVAALHNVAAGLASVTDAVNVPAPTAGVDDAPAVPVGTLTADVQVSHDPSQGIVDPNFVAPVTAPVEAAVSTDSPADASVDTPAVADVAPVVEPVEVPDPADQVTEIPAPADGTIAPDAGASLNA